MTSSKKLIQASAGNVAGGGFYPYTVDYSARFNGADNAYLAKTFSSTPTSRTTCTISVWVKLTGKRNGSNINTLWGTAGNWEAAAFIEPGNINGWRADQIRVTGMTSPQPTLRTTSVYRDYSGWFNFITVWDSTNATAADRQRLYINGVRLTDFDQQVTASLNQQLIEWLSTTAATNIGITGGSTVQSFDGYMAEVVVLDGTAASPTDLGELKNGVWVPKDPSGLSFGNNGFWLDFSNSAALGTDVSGNSNNFTTSGLTSSDQMPDTPTSNFATLNPLLQFPTGGGYTGAMYNGNLEKYGAADNSYTGAYSTIAMPPNTGKWYSEHYLVTENRNGFGISYAPTDAGSMNPNDSNTYGYYLFCYSGWGYSVLYAGLTTVETVTNLSAGEIVGILYDSDNLEVTFFVNGTQAGSTMSVPSATYLFFADGYGVSPRIYNVSNFGQDSTFGGRITAGGNTDANGLGDFKYTVPTDALALCTANLPEPTIGPNSTTKTDEVFAPILYTGNGTSQSISTLDFQPDFTWIKNRDAADNHMLFDAVRGATKYSNSNTTNAEATDAQSLSSFNSNGFSVGNNVAVNTNTEDYVAWNWKANGSGVSNTDGATASTVSVNTDAGFSIVTYTGTGSVTTVGHGLGVTPNFIIVKARDKGAGYNWCSYSSMLGPTYNTGGLDVTSAADAHPNYWANTAPTSSVFTISTYGVVNDSGGQMLAYCFAEVEGFSSFGSYTGNGSADGPFIYTGFRPAYVMIKWTSGANDWVIDDSARIGHNPNNYDIYANSSVAEADNDRLDLLSNGFKIRSSPSGANSNGGTYIYIAFAENPFKYSNAR